MGEDSGGLCGYVCYDIGEMIIVRLQGGLGNQMFQYAAARALALKHRVPVKVDASLYETAQTGITPRKFELSCFSVDVLRATPLEIERLKGGGSLVGKIMRKIGLSRQTSYVRERHFHFDERILEAPQSAYLDGYFASERYFSTGEDVLRKEFTFREPLAGANAERAAEMRSCSSVSLHVRRGDYVTDKKTNEFHGCTDIPYYERAIHSIADRVKDPHFFIFSDDIEWVRAHLPLGFPATHIDHNKGDEAYKDMQLMSACRHHVIANSSFSWWGAWLDPNPAKIVVAPDRWFADARVNTKDVIPPSWIRL